MNHLNSIEWGRLAWFMRGMTGGMPTMLDELPLELHELYHSLYAEWATHLAS